MLEISVLWGIIIDTAEHGYQRVIENITGVSASGFQNEVKHLFGDCRGPEGPRRTWNRVLVENQWRIYRVHHVFQNGICARQRGGRQ